MSVRIEDIINSLNIPYNAKQYALQALGSWRYFMSKGYLQLYKQIFGISQYPYWTALQIVWSCYAVHRVTKKGNKNIINRIIRFIVSAFVSFGAREIFAYMFRMQSPTTAKPMQLVFFAIINLLLEFCPGDLIFKLCTTFAPILNLFQAVNQIRFYSIISRKTAATGTQAIVFILLFLTIDQLIVSILKSNYHDESNFCGWSTLVRTAFLCTVHFFGCRQSVLTPYIGGPYNSKFTMLILVALDALMNCAAVTTLETEDSKTNEAEQKEHKE